MHALPKNDERRTRARLTEVSPISIRRPADRGRVTGRMFNRSDTGVYFETDSRLEPGSEVYIGVGRSAKAEGDADYCCCAARVVWCRELADDAHYRYGCGASFEEPKAAGGADPGREKRKHPRRTFRKAVQLVDEDSFFKAMAEDISATGMFLKSGRRPRPGQTLTLGIPDKTGRTVAVRAKVMWSNANGFGLKFTRKAS